MPRTSIKLQYQELQNKYQDAVLLNRHYEEIFKNQDVVFSSLAVQICLLKNEVAEFWKVFRAMQEMKALMTNIIKAKDEQLQKGFNNRSPL